MWKCKQFPIILIRICNISVGCGNKRFVFCICICKKQQAATCRFSKEFSENPGKILTNRKEGIKIQKRILDELPVFKRVL